MESASNSLVNQEQGDTDEFVRRFGKIQICNHLEDRISYLPDELLLSVLSRLDIEQQARTSLLARRWTNLWRHAMNLKFVFQTGYSSEDPVYNARRRNFVARVNRILELLLVTSIEDFTVIFRCYEKSCQRDIDGWLQFALQKRVKQLEFALGPDLKDFSAYSLTNEVIRNHKVDSLTSVNLGELDVAGDFLEYLLSVSPFLEELSVSHSKTLVNFTVTGQSLKLKYLEITSCFKLEHLYIFGVNLVSFNYFGYSKCVAIKDTPNLVKAQLSFLLVDNDMQNLAQIFSHFPPLDTLVLVPNILQKVTYLPKFPMLKYLKNLELVLYNKHNNICGLLCALLLEASPLLRELKVEFRFENTSEATTIQRLEHRHTGLKVAKFNGFIGCNLQLGVALYVIENTAALEKMIVDTNPSYKSIAMDPDKQDTARTLARARLSEKLPLGVQLIVL